MYKVSSFHNFQTHFFQLQFNWPASKLIRWPYLRCSGFHAVETIFSNREILKPRSQALTRLENSPWPQIKRREVIIVGKNFSDMEAILIALKLSKPQSQKAGLISCTVIKRREIINSSGKNFLAREATLRSRFYKVEKWICTIKVLVKETRLTTSWQWWNGETIRTSDHD